MERYGVGVVGSGFVGAGGIGGGEKGKGARGGRGGKGWVWWEVATGRFLGRGSTRHSIQSDGTLFLASFLPILHQTSASPSDSTELGRRTFELNWTELGEVILLMC